MRMSIPEFIRPALDEEERSRTETENGQTLVLVDIPIVENTDDKSVYSTIPLGIIITKNNIINGVLKGSGHFERFYQ